MTLGQTKLVREIKGDVFDVAGKPTENGTASS